MPLIGQIRILLGKVEVLCHSLDKLGYYLAKWRLGISSKKNQNNGFWLSLIREQNLLIILGIRSNQKPICGM